MATKTKTKKRKAAATKVKTITRYRAPKKKVVRRKRKRKSAVLSTVPGKAAVAAATGAVMSYPMVFNQVEKLPDVAGLPKTLLAGVIAYYLNEATLKNSIVRTASESAIIAGAFQAGTNYKKPLPMTIQGDEYPYTVSGEIAGDDAEFVDVSGAADADEISEHEEIIYVDEEGNELEDQG